MGFYTFSNAFKFGHPTNNYLNIVFNTSLRPCFAEHSQRCADGDVGDVVPPIFSNLQESWSEVSYAARELATVFSVTFVFLVAIVDQLVKTLPPPTLTQNVSLHITESKYGYKSKFWKEILHICLPIELLSKISDNTIHYF